MKMNLFAKLSRVHTGIVAIYCLLSTVLLMFAMYNNNNNNNLNAVCRYRWLGLCGEEQRNDRGGNEEADFAFSIIGEPSLTQLLTTSNNTANTTSLKIASQARTFKPVIILSYQRCGSSFLGNLFNLDSQVFYVYEPLDALYSSLYGTSPGWNVPSDIFTHNNGTARMLPASEIHAVPTYLHNLLSCKVGQLPTELLGHSFWDIPYHKVAENVSASSAYASCLHRRVGSRTTIRSGLSKLKTLCGKRFSDKDERRHEYCRQMLHDSNFRTKQQSAGIVFENYRVMIDIRVRNKLNAACVPLFRSLCVARHVHATKLVRASMSSLRPLLDWLPDLRVIHLIRDPRPVVLSRWDFDPSGMAAYSDSRKNQSERVVHEASIYCRQVVDDVRWRRRLEQQFPGRLYSLTYEQLTDSPIEQAEHLYRFIGETPGPGVLDLFAKMALGNVNKTARWLATRWLKDRISKLAFDEINKQCSELFKFYPQFMSLMPTLFKL